MLSIHYIYVHLLSLSVRWQPARSLHLIRHELRLISFFTSNVASASIPWFAKKRFFETSWVVKLSANKGRSKSYLKQPASSRAPAKSRDFIKVEVSQVLAGRNFPKCWLVMIVYQCIYIYIYNLYASLSTFWHVTIQEILMQNKQVRFISNTMESEGSQPQTFSDFRHRLGNGNILGNDTRYQVYAYAHKKKTDILSPKMEIWINFLFNRSDVQVLAGLCTLLLGRGLLWS